MNIIQVHCKPRTIRILIEKTLNYVMKMIFNIQIVHKNLIALLMGYFDTKF